MNDFELMKKVNQGNIILTVILLLALVYKLFLTEMESQTDAVLYAFTLLQGVVLVSTMIVELRNGDNKSLRYLAKVLLYLSIAGLAVSGVVLYNSATTNESNGGFLIPLLISINCLYKWIELKD